MKLQGVVYGVVQVVMVLRDSKMVAESCIKVGKSVVLHSISHKTHACMSYNTSAQQKATYHYLKHHSAHGVITLL